MIEYKCVTRHVRSGFLAEAADRVNETVQPMLDAGAGAGWRLHSFSTSTAPDGDVTFVSIWERAKPSVQDTVTN